MVSVAMGKPGESAGLTIDTETIVENSLSFGFALGIEVDDESVRAFSSLGQ